MCKRHLVDPDGKYNCRGPSRVELVAVQLLEILPCPLLERTRNVIQLEVPSEPGIILLVTGDHVEFRLPIIEWTCGAYAPAPSSRFWKRMKVPASGQLNQSRFMAILDEARRVRAAEFAVCRFCEENFPPEHRHGDACQACSEKHLGIVH